MLLRNYISIVGLLEGVGDVSAPLTLDSSHFAILIGWCVFMLAMGWCITFWLIRRSPGAIERALREAILPKILTIILVLLATTILALTGKLTEGAAAILSGVVGYVLGTTHGMGRRSIEMDEKSAEDIKSQKE